MADIKGIPIIVQGIAGTGNYCMVNCPTAKRSFYVIQAIPKKKNQ